MNSRQRAIYWRRQDRIKRALERRFITEVWRALELQVKPIIEALEFMSVDMLSTRVDNLIKQDSIRTVFLQMYRETGGRFAKTAITNLKTIKGLVTKREQSLLEDPEAYETLYLQSISDYVLTEAGGRIVTITETSRKQALEIINQLTERAIAEGIGINEAAAYLRREFPVEWRKKKWRAELIARTEINTAANQGAEIGAKATGLELNKMWVTALDGRERPSHRFADGQVRTMDGMFLVGNTPMSKPGAAGAPAEEVCNCRCAVAYISPRLSLN